MMRLLPAVAILALCSAVQAAAQPTKTQQYDTVAQPQEVDSTTQAMDMRFGKDGYERMTVPVRVAGYGPYRFLIDTGADRTAISRELANRLRLMGRSTTTLHSVSGISEVGTANVPVLDVSAKQVKNVDAALLEAGNMGADGILGLDSLHSQRILFDFKQEKLTIVPANARMPSDPGSIVVTGRIKNGRLIVTTAYAENNAVTIVVDTGAQVSIGNEALKRKLDKGGRIKRAGLVELQSVTGEKLAGQYMIVRELNVGGVTLKQLPVVFADSHAFQRLGLNDRPALLLGMNALRSFDRVSIDFAKKKLRVVLPEEGAVERSAFASL
jgi:predicted aspartyl protease